MTNKMPNTEFGITEDCSNFNFSIICTPCQNNTKQYCIVPGILISLEKMPKYGIRLFASSAAFLEYNGDLLKEIVEKKFPQHLELLEKYLILK